MTEAREGSDNRSELVEKSLAKDDLHQQWGGEYLSDENEKLFDLVFDCIAQVLNAPSQATILDAGAGSCVHAIRLAKRGFLVRGVDFSDAALETGRSNIEKQNVKEKVTMQKGTILSLPFEDESFEYVICWGVLMHVPEIETAIKELARVTKPGGKLVIGENNMNSLECIIVRTFKKIFKKKESRISRSASGIEYWNESSAGPYLYRDANINWMIGEFNELGFDLEKRMPSQFTEIFVHLPTAFVKKFVHWFNRFWLKFVKIPYVATGNVLFFQKRI